MTVAAGRILIAGGGTGGHLMPALAIADTLRQLAPQLEPVLVGSLRGIEAQVLPGRAYRHHLLPTEPIYRRTWWRNARWPWLGIRLVREVRELLRREAPVAVVGTGGYASAPVVWMAARAGIPTAVQEQNAHPGLATRLLARRVRHIYLGVPEAERLLRPGNGALVFDTGNPIAPPAPGRRTAARERFGLTGTRPVLLVTGGSQGALAINRAVAQWLGSGAAAGWEVIWLTGRGTHAEFAALHNPPAVQVLDFLDPMADAYAVADMVVSRAGMMTVAEVSAWGLPSILVPLPGSAADHQAGNARVMADAGAAILLPQDRMLADGLGPTVARFEADPGLRAGLAARARARGRPDAAREIGSRILGLIARA